MKASAKLMADSHSYPNGVASGDSVLGWIRIMKDLAPLTTWEDQRPILVPVDFSSASIAAIQEGARLARAISCSLTLLHVIEVCGSVPTDEPALPEIRYRTAMDSATNSLAQIARGLTTFGLEVTALVSEGIPAEKILGLAAHHRSIVLGKPRPRLFYGWFSKRTVPAVIDASPCPVILVAAPPAISR
jgi:nucleotide-binding universal stress UspA family protein